MSSELDKAWVSIDLTLRDNTLIYKVENSRSNQPVKHSRRDYAEGIGLDNLKRRLALIYKEGYDLKIFDEETTFLAVLKLNLDFKPLVPKHLLTYSAPAESSNPRKKICFIKISPESILDKAKYMKLRCLIVDDEPLALDVLENYLSRLEDIELCGRCSNAIDAFNFLCQKPVDLIFWIFKCPN